MIYGDNLRLAGLISIICLASLAWSDGGVVNELEKMLSKAGNDREFLAMLTQSIKLIGESSLKLLTGDVGELGFCN